MRCVDIIELIIKILSNSATLIQLRCKGLGRWKVFQVFFKCGYV